MKYILFFLVALLLFQSGCANSPSIEERQQQEQQESQTLKRSDAFARDLPQ